jgi:hypothetical protein
MKITLNRFRNEDRTKGLSLGAAIVSSVMFMVPFAFSGMESPIAQAEIPFVLTTQPIAQLTPRQPILPSAIATAIRQDLAKRTGSSPTQFKIVSATPQTWGNGCLDLGSPAEMCTQMLVEGWRVEASDGAQTWIYHTDGVGTNLRLAEADQATLPTPVARKVLNTIAQQVRVPVAKLNITEVKSAVWNGCLGIYQAKRPCTKIAIQGWQIIASDRYRSWVYHLNQDGSKVVQNRTASRGQAPVVTSFRPFGDLPGVESQVLFRSIVTGSISGEVRTLTLTRDGTLTQFITSPTIRSQPIVLKKLSPAELKRFTQLLEQQQMPNLAGISYFTSAVYADHPHTTFQGMGSSVQFIDSEMAKMPRSLQQIAKAWTNLPKQR